MIDRVQNQNFGFSGDIKTIHAGMPFARTLVQSLLQQTKDDPQVLARYTLLLPTRRACRVVQEEFLRFSEGHSLLLPKLTPIGDVEEEDLSLLMFGATGEFLDIPAAVPALERQLLLAKLVLANPHFMQGPDQALRLGKALAQFLDQVIVEGLEFKDLSSLVPEDFSAHWQITLEFLKIISEAWPHILAERGYVDAAERRNLLLQHLSAYWTDYPPDFPVIAAGATGSIPAAAGLLKVIAGLPQGTVILPGLDAGMDDESWSCLDETHAQYSMKKLLRDMGVERSQVGVFGDDLAGVSRHSEREVLAREIMRPAQTTSQWKRLSEEWGGEDGLRSLTDGIEYYSCSTMQEEALLTALLFREILEEDGKTAALVTPDRNLARRVAAQCQRWGIHVDDSAGVKLSQAELGTYLLLSAEFAASQFDAVKFLSLLKHPLSRLGYEVRDYNDALARIEIEYLRSEKRQVNSLDDLLEHTLAAGDALCSDFVRLFKDAFDLFRGEGGSPYKRSLRDLIISHLQMAETLGQGWQMDGASRLWRGEAGEAASVFFSELRQHDDALGEISVDDYPLVLRQFLNDVVVRTAYGLHPRLKILGQLEARLVDTDLVVLGGLNEDVWPPKAGSDPWMSRPMRKSYGLPGLEQSVGLAAHDFVQGLCSSRVVMTRAEKVDGTPMLPARWLQKLETVMLACDSDISILSKEPYLQWVRLLDEADEVSPCARPSPRPPLDARPDMVSVTKVDQWLKDPYGIYARYTLGLKPLQPLVQKIDFSLQGKVLHKAIEDFVQDYPDQLPSDASDILNSYFERSVRLFAGENENLDFWKARIGSTVDWFLEHEGEWRKSYRLSATEAWGETVFDVDGKSFLLRGIVDRIDKGVHGYAIVDYKSGGQFSRPKLLKGELPQLPLEAILLQRGGFDDLKRGDDAELVPYYLGYWKFSSGEKGGETVYLEDGFGETLAIVEDGFLNLVRVFYALETSFYAVPDGGNLPRFNDYEHLARVREWSVLDSDASEAQ